MWKHLVNCKRTSYWLLTAFEGVRAEGIFFVDVRLPRIDTEVSYCSVLSMHRFVPENIYTFWVKHWKGHKLSSSAG